MPLDSQTATLVAGGQLARLDLVRFDLPGKVVGYHRGGRPYTYNGLTYLPNRWLSPGGLSGSLGTAVTTRTLEFSNIPVENPDDAIAAIELYNYVNAPVIVTHLAGDLETDQVVGVLASSIYEIDQVRYRKGAMGANGERALSLMIDLQPPGRSARGATLVKCSTAEQQFDNDPNDTSLEYASTTATVAEEWGQREQ